jgi:hypothetical protein
LANFASVLIYFIYSQKYATFIRFLPYGNDSSTVTEDWAFIVNNSVLTYTKDSKDDTGKDFISLLKLVFKAF